MSKIADLPAPAPQRPRRILRSDGWYVSEAELDRAVSEAVAIAEHKAALAHADAMKRIEAYVTELAEKQRLEVKLFASNVIEQIRGQ